MKLCDCEFPNRVIVKRSSDIIVQEQGKLFGEQDKLSQPPGSTDAHRSSHPSPHCPPTCSLFTFVPSLPSWEKLVTLAHLELIHLELEQYKLETPN